MTLNKKKCEFRVKKVIFLGHHIGEKGISPDQVKIEAITEMRPPKCLKEHKSFLGMINYHHKFSPRLAELSKPRQDLNKKHGELHWDIDQQNSFQALKREISNAPVLAKYDVRVKPSHGRFQ